jgi:MFS family permease
MFKKFKATYSEYPSAFKVLTLATFIDMLGGFLLMPFFALYITERFHVGILEVGLLIAINSVGNIIGGLIGGALADKYGRRSLILFGLIVSGVGSILMGLANNLMLFYLLAAFLGLIGSFGGPARQAMVADLLPKSKQAEGFGILRISFNLSATIGPILGGFLATHSYMFLFIADAVSSLITAVIVFLVIPETKPERKEGKPEETVLKTVIGYKDVLKDWLYVSFLSVSAIMVIVYVQMNSTLSVFLRDVHGYPASGFGLLLSMNALMVVLFQFWITRRISKRNPMKMMVLGTFFYLLGFSMYGFVSEIYLFFVAMILITIGEMIVTPIGTTIASFFAPEDKRGRYMAMYGFSWAIPNIFGVLLAGVVWDSLGPFWVWYFAGILSLVSMLGYWFLRKAAKDRLSREMENNVIQLQKAELTEEVSEFSH